MDHRADRPVMLRAGGETRGVPALTGRPQTLLSDLSEFEPEIADALYLNWSRAIIIRAAYGDAHDDRAWYGGQRRALLHQGGAAFLGIYQYLVAGQDPAAQAREFVRLVGKLEPGELPICDLEEGDGDQSGRWQAWKAVIEDSLGFSPWLYSGLFYASAHGLNPQWIAAYQGNEPRTPHWLWQFSSSYPVPGVGLADCSVFRGTIDQLAAYAYQPGQPPQEGWTERMITDLPVLAEGATDKPGQVFFVTRLQSDIACYGRINGIAAAACQGETGTFDSATTAAVKAVQAHKGLTQDGIVGKLTWGVLIAGIPA